MGKDEDGNIKLDTESVSRLEGQSLTFKYGGTALNVNLGNGPDYDYSTAEKAEESFQKALKQVSIGNGKTLGDVLTVTTEEKADDDGPNSKGFSLNLSFNGEGGNSLLITGGSTDVLKALGILGENQNDISEVSDADKEIKQDGIQNDNQQQSFFKKKDFFDRIGGKSITFTYNGTGKSISFMDSESLKLQLNANASNDDALNVVKKDLQEKLDKAFGTGRIAVSIEGSHLEFHTTLPGGSPDNSSVLSISSGSADLLGKDGALNVAYGESNRLNLSASLAESGLKDITGKLPEYLEGTNKVLIAVKALGEKVQGSTTIEDLKNLIKENNPHMSDGDLESINKALDYYGSTEGGGHTTVGSSDDGLQSAMEKYSNQEMKLKINGTDIKGLTYNSSLSQIISAVNSSDARVTMSYMSAVDKFSIVSTEGGAAGKISFKLDPEDENSSTGDAGLLFGSDINNVSQGTDAVVAVKYAGSDDVIELTRGSNTFSLDGMTITANGTFGTFSYDTDGKLILDANSKLPNTEPVTFTSKLNTDKITSAVSDMIKDYNSIVDLVNSQLTTKPNRDYAPLTDEQKADMTESQIKAWEDKAKTGLLFNDSDLRTLSDSLRFIINSGSADKKTLESYGITISSSYGDNGKLVFDESKFRAALEADPETLKKVFTRTSNSATGESDGIMAKMKAVTDKYASTSGAVKGILIEKAGSTYSPTSILSNSLQKSMDSLDDYIKTLQDKLSTETDRYISQFTNLETLISQMNSQSSYLSSLSS
jgi:flagellar hook-associated protein 2